MTSQTFLQYLLGGLFTITVLALIALGLYIIFGLMNVINMAHGDFYMLGAYATYTLTASGLPYWVAIPLAAVASGLVGAAVERLVVRRLYGRADLSTLLATWGVSVVLQEGIKLIYSPHPLFVRNPFAGATVSIFGASYPLFQLVVMFLTLAVVGVLVWFTMRTPFGVVVRATMANEPMVAGLGVNTQAVYFWAFAVGCGLAGLAGGLMAPLVTIVPTMGVTVVLKAFLVVIAGGVQSVFSALGGSLIMGGTDSLVTILSNSILANLVMLLIVMIVMLVKPRGLFER